MTPRRADHYIADRVGRADRTWVDDAACKGNTAVFFSCDPADTATAKALCAGCPVRSDCDVFADRIGVIDGTWAGLTEQERLQRRGRTTRAERRARRVAGSACGVERLPIQAAVIAPASDGAPTSAFMHSTGHLSKLVSASL